MIGNLRIVSESFATGKSYTILVADTAFLVHFVVFKMLHAHALPLSRSNQDVIPVLLSSQLANHSYSPGKATVTLTSSS